MQTLTLELPARIMTMADQVLVPMGMLLQDESIRTVARPEILLLFLVLWLLLRRSHGRADMTTQGESILEARYKRGEITKETYDRIRNRTHEPGR